MVLQVSCSSRVPRLVGPAGLHPGSAQAQVPAFGWCLERFGFYFQADLSSNTNFLLAQCCVQYRLTSLGLGLFTCRMRTIRAPTSQMVVGIKCGHLYQHLQPEPGTE